MNVPNPLRLPYRYLLTEAISLVVRDRKSAQSVVDELGLTEDKAPGFPAMLLEELGKLEIHNCAHYRLTLAETRSWIAANRPN